jgi:hypothetical protein
MNRWPLNLASWTGVGALMMGMRGTALRVLAKSDMIVLHWLHWLYWVLAVSGADVSYGLKGD